MDSGSGFEGRSHGDGMPANGPDTSAAEAALAAKLSRKRTKTGCLTCRKRRIKCDEGQPTCRNCHKSKRVCDGYNNRVLFRSGTLQNGPSVAFQAGQNPGPLLPFPPLQSLGFPPTSTFNGNLQGASLEQYTALLGHHPQNGPPLPQQQFHQGMMPNTNAMLEQLHLNQAHASPKSLEQVATALSLDQQRYLGQRSPYDAQQMPIRAPPMVPPQGPFGMPQPNTDPLIYNPLPIQTQSPSHTRPIVGQGMSYFAQSGSHTSQPGTPYGVTSNWDGLMFSQNTSPPHQPNASATATPPQSAMFTPSPVLDQQNWQRIGSAGTEPSHTSAWGHGSTKSSPSQYNTGGVGLHTPQAHAQGRFQFDDDVTLAAPASMDLNSLLSAAAVRAQDDDYYDVYADESEKEYLAGDVEMSQYGGEMGTQTTLSGLLGMNQMIALDQQTRTYDTFLYPGILDQYRAEQAANPLKNDATKRIFAHFISVTGPSLSIFERHHRNTSMLFNNGAIPTSQQGIWTYILPSAALQNQALLQAMLAMASLHIARIQGASTTPSMKHYSWASKSVLKCLGNPTKRRQATNIAATLLLGFYEIMTADHLKWNMHLSGAMQLLIETDFAQMAREFRRMKRERAAGFPLHGNHTGMQTYDFRQTEVLDQILDVDDRVVSFFVGREVRYDDHGNVEELVEPSMSSAGLDLANFEIMKDLYWWYAKQDVYQSIVSGNPLLMNFSRWAECPPRAPLGHPGAVYGSFDHLILLLARIANFASQDRARKLKQIEANGGHWRPPPSMQIPKPPQAAQSSPPQPQAPPQFYGMAPPPRTDVRMPSSYAPNNSGTTASPSNDPAADCDLEEATNAAKGEIGRIRAALQRFREALELTFPPLGPEHCDSPVTAFGVARTFSSADISCLWAIYHMAEIIAIRSHPDMPPAAHVAAAVAAHSTHEHAQEIGRIAAGLYATAGDCSRPVNPTLGAALCESCMPSFFAAIQYVDAGQRAETAQQIFSISRRTGWGSGELIANGCETAWVKAAEANRGPPYSRILRPEFSDDPRLNGSWERLNPDEEPPDDGDDADRRLIKKKPNARLFWGVGVMGREGDV